MSTLTAGLARNFGSRWDTLGIASRVYVISLPRRADRRKGMEALREALSLRWTYVDAFDSTDEVVARIYDCVRMERDLTNYGTDKGTNGSMIESTAKSTFRWPENIDLLALLDDPLEVSGSDLWLSSASTPDLEPRSLSLSVNPGDRANFEGNSNGSTIAPLICATEDDFVSPYVFGLPDYRILTPPKIACWHSHLSVIRRVANDEGKHHGVTVILEDDIDMEQDVRERLASVWESLPNAWDIVFLGEG